MANTVFCLTEVLKILFAGEESQGARALCIVRQPLTWSGTKFSWSELFRNFFHHEETVVPGIFLQYSYIIGCSLKSVGLGPYCFC